MAKTATEPVRRPNGVEHIPTRSIRVDDETWAKARKRAEARGGRVSRVAALLVEQYADGKIALFDEVD